MSDNIIRLFVLIASKTNDTNDDYNIDNLIIGNPESKNPIMCSINHQRSDNLTTIKFNDNREIKIRYNPLPSTRVEISIKLDNNKYYFLIILKDEDFKYFYMYNKLSKIPMQLVKETSDSFTSEMITEEELDIIKNAIYNEIYEVDRKKFYKALVMRRAGHRGFINT